VSLGPQVPLCQCLASANRLEAARGILNLSQRRPWIMRAHKSAPLPGGPRNCTHLANAEIIPEVRVVCENAGYVCPKICTPEELMGI
jgi:hypothetical protein